MKQFIRHSFLPLAIIFSVYSIISFMHSCSDGSDSSEEPSFLTQSCSKTWEERYSMLSLDLSWVLNDGDLKPEDHQTSDTSTYKVSAKDNDTIVYTITGDDSGSSQETKTQFEQKCEQTKARFKRSNSMVSNQTKTISGKTYDCKYLTTTLSKEEASQISGSDPALINQATSSILYHSYVTSKEMFTLSEEILFEKDGTKYVMRKNITSIN